MLDADHGSLQGQEEAQADSGDGAALAQPHCGHASFGVWALCAAQLALGKSHTLDCQSQTILQGAASTNDRGSNNVLDKRKVRIVGSSDHPQPDTAGQKVARQGPLLSCLSLTLAEDRPVCNSLDRPICWPDPSFCSCQTLASLMLEAQPCKQAHKRWLTMHLLDRPIILSLYLADIDACWERRLVQCIMNGL